MRSNIPLCDKDSKTEVTMSDEHNYLASKQIFYVNFSLRGWNTRCAYNLTRDDYTLIKGVGAYKLNTRLVWWNNAREICRDEGGHLAMINSLAEESALLNMMRSEDVDAVWLGVHDLFGEGVWVTLDGESLDTVGYNKWTTHWPDQPDNYGGYQNCGVLVKYGGMDDTVCTQRTPFICEIEICNL
ncbi:hemolymph lipopolysaccharide-binding protein-like [Colletes gigas]|uniref:hemolymph lipopolysaccharide-binding protein-like n=1 Tax=Colletes gigas TaxID=935657 RepID=UPI001C9AD2A0|nr:hemolymph lipopolysaccharide-binding protein-like [Colletes gigas]